MKAAHEELSGRSVQDLGVVDLLELALLITATGRQVVPSTWSWVT